MRWKKNCRQNNRSMIKNYDLVRAKEEINDKIPRYSLGVVLDVSADGTFFVIEFFDDKENTLDGGATIVKSEQVFLYESHSS
ncbi:MAG: hypothetical protein KBF82_12860 [Chitinophagaceae bacterium]|nr:hypothetical protein [Chitinophagaceae bacterium]MBP9104752.1 hypothetical protein [Chitinophagaceae bacterium]